MGYFQKSGHNVQIFGRMKMNKTVKTLGALSIGFIFVTLLFWLSGYNFDQRGILAVEWFLFSCGGGFITWLIVQDSINELE